MTACKIEDTRQCEEIMILFGTAFRGGKVCLYSAEEVSGKTCYALSCSVSGIDIELNDE